jgi:hypothetical protein
VSEDEGDAENKAQLEMPSEYTLEEGDYKCEELFYTDRGMCVLKIEKNPGLKRPPTPSCACQPPVFAARTFGPTAALRR